MKTGTKQELLDEIMTLPSNLTKDVLEFVCFIKAKSAIDPTQAYFWTKKWQKMEQEAEENIKTGKINRYNSVQEFKIKMGD